MFIKFMDAARRLDEFYYLHDNERIVRVVSILKLYVEIINKYKELAEQYKAPVRDKFAKMNEEFVNELRANKGP